MHPFVAPVSTHALVVLIQVSQSFNAQALHKKATIHQATTMLATSKSVLFPGHNHHANHQY